MNETAMQIEQALHRLQGSRFRRGFQLAAADQRYLDDRGLDAVADHARRFITQRLGPAEPARDGRQTPWRGHPVFVAQHATATCCRRCLAKWHGIAAGNELTEADVDYAVGLVAAWLRQRHDPANADAGGLFE